MALQTKTVSTGDYAVNSWSNGYVITLALTEWEVDFKTNTSSVSYKFTVSNTDSKRCYAPGYSWNISIAGQTIPIVDFDFDLRRSFTNRVIASGRLAVKHNLDGTLDMPYAVSIPNVQADNVDAPPAMELTGTWKLAWIPRVPEVYCPDGLIGETVRIQIGALDSNLTYSLTYSFLNLSGVIAEKTEATEIPWTIPEKFYNQLPKEKEGICVITCMAYSADTEIGGGVCEFTVGVDPKASVPAVSAEIADSNPATVAVTGDAGQLVRYCSDAYVKAVCKGKNGAVVEDYRMTNNGTVYTDRTVTVKGVEKGVFRFDVTDSRGSTSTLTVTKPMIPYIKLTCNLGDNKPDGDGNMTVKVSGNYFNSSFGAQSNTLAVWYRYKVSGGNYGDWISLEANVGAKSYTAQAELTGLDYQTTYVFQARAEDKLRTVDSAEYAVRATPVFDWDENDFNVNGTFKINNEAVADFVVARGSTGIWTWERWNSGIAKCWGRTGEKTFTFTGDGPVYHSDTVHSYVYPFALTEVISVNADILSAGYVVPVILSVNDSVKVSFVRLYGDGQPVKGYYTFAVIGRWK